MDYVKSWQKKDKNLCLKVCQQNVAQNFGADAINGITIHLESIHRLEEIETNTENAPRDLPALQFQNFMFSMHKGVCTQSRSTHLYQIRAISK